MFGYVMVNKPELKVKDYEKYRAYYCGLCLRLKKRHGRRGQITLTYDMTFLIILLTSLYECTTHQEKHKCLTHPGRKHPMLWNEISDYAADMNVLLAYENFLDDWQDEHKITALLGKLLYRAKYKKVARHYERQSKVIESSLNRLSQCEQENNYDIDTVSGCFGELMAELFVFRKDPFEATLRRIGFFLGKYIYIMDAVMDLREDMEKGNYNPFSERSKQEDFDEYARELLVLMISEVTKEVDKLPCELDMDILNNILYQGVWTKYERKRQNDK